MAEILKREASGKIPHDPNSFPQKVLIRANNSSSIKPRKQFHHFGHRQGWALDPKN